jgi:hypothetical protein
MERVGQGPGRGLGNSLDKYLRRHRMATDALGVRKRSAAGAITPLAFRLRLSFLLLSVALCVTTPGQATSA